MTEHKIILEKLIQSIKEYGRIIFVLLAFSVGAYVGEYFPWVNTHSIVIITSFLSGCIIALVAILNILNGDEKDE